MTVFPDLLRNAYKAPASDQNGRIAMLALGDATSNRGPSNHQRHVPMADKEIKPVRTNSNDAHTRKSPGGTMSRNRYALVLGLLVCLTAAVATFDVTETTDFPGGLNFTFDPNIGTLAQGANTVSGSLNGFCLVGTFGRSCNPGTVEGGDTQDSFLLTVPAGYQMTSLTVTTSAVSGPAGFSASMELDSPSGPVQFTPFLSPLPGTTGNLLTAPVGAGVYAISVFGQNASADGAFSLNWSVAMNLAPVVGSPADAVTNLINLISDPLSGLVLTTGQSSSLTDKLNNALTSIQMGLYKQAINQLTAFINSVQTYLKNGKISAQTATTLTIAANAIITSLQ
jgi:hypothetical protein